MKRGGRRDPSGVRGFLSKKFLARRWWFLGREAFVSYSSFLGAEMHGFVETAVTCIVTQYTKKIWFCCHCVHLRMRIQKEVSLIVSKEKVCTFERS